MPSGSLWMKENFRGKIVSKRVGEGGRGEKGDREREREKGTPAGDTVGTARYTQTDTHLYPHGVVHFSTKNYWLPFSKRELPIAPVQLNYCDHPSLLSYFHRPILAFPLVDKIRSRKSQIAIFS